MIKLKINLVSIITFGLLFILYFVFRNCLLTDKLNMMLVICIGTVLFTFAVFFFVFTKKSREGSPLILVPLIITAFQNVFLGINISEISTLEMVFFVIVNYLYACVLVVLVFFATIGDTKWDIGMKVLLMLGIIVFYSFFLLVNSKTSFTAFISSFRNVTCPIIFFLIGAMMSKKIDLDRLIDLFLILFIVVFAIGLYERIIDDKFWLNLNIGELWSKKGIYYDLSTGKPYNHYSAERIFGSPMRRMVSTFGEPVNLGTFFVLAFHLSWWDKKYIKMVFALIGCIFTISKGALLGILLLCVVEAYYRFNKKSFLLIALGFAVLTIYMYFVIGHAGASMAVHINGFLNGFKSLFSNPLGTGLGNAGVYGNLFAMDEGNSVQESGIGVIIGQLGVVGFLCYFSFLIVQIMSIHRKQYSLCKREKIFSYTLVFSYALLLMFSESAMGPNASAGYMAIIGIVCSQIERKGKISNYETVL